MSTKRRPQKRYSKHRTPEYRTGKRVQDKAVRGQERSCTLTGFSVFCKLIMPYRIPMRVKNAIIFRRCPVNDIYYRCPRCQNLLEREFVAYCSRCGQCLDWKNYRKAKRTYFQAKG